MRARRRTPRRTTKSASTARQPRRPGERRYLLRVHHFICPAECAHAPSGLLGNFRRPRRCECRSWGYSCKHGTLYQDGHAHGVAAQKTHTSSHAKHRRKVLSTWIALSPTRFPLRARIDASQEQEELRRAATMAVDVGEGEARPQFLDNVARDVYASAETGAVADRINQTKHYMQRGSKASAENFLRR
eukprot:6212272-Pleurochrysis_carterae.AAC.1